jgi:hypothetical protein
MSTRTQRNTFIVRKNGKQVFPEWPGEILADVSLTQSDIERMKRQGYLGAGWAR